MTANQRPDELDKALLASLTRAGYGRVAIRAAVIVAMYAGVTVLALRPEIGWWAPAFSVFLAFMLTGFLNAVHDCVHRAHLRSKLGNRIAGAAWGTPIALNFTIYRHLHLIHHRFTGVEGDTERPFHFEKATDYLHAVSGVSYWPALAKSIFAKSRGKFPDAVSQADRRRDALIDNWLIVGWLALMVILTVLFPFALLVAYWLPLVLVVPMAMILSIPEHYGLWGTSDVMRNTRTIRSCALVRYFMWNGNYHAEHHRYPAVASVNLHRLHKAMPVPHPVQEKSYVRFHWGLMVALLKGTPIPGYGETSAGQPEAMAGQG
jgi:fatty acid desaturase